MSRTASSLLLSLLLGVAATRGSAEEYRAHIPTLDEVVSDSAVIAVVSVAEKKEASIALEGRRVVCGSLFHGKVRDLLKGDGGDVAFFRADDGAFVGVGDYLVLLIRRDPAKAERELDDVVVPSGKLDGAAIDRLRCGIRAADNYAREMIAFDAAASARYRGRWLRPHGPDVASRVRRRETMERGGESYEVVAWEELRALLVDALRASRSD